MHFPVPDLVNAVGVGCRTALVQRGTATSQVSSIDPAEQALIDAGELVEHALPRGFDTRPGEGLVEKRDRLDVLYVSEKARVRAALATELEYWGYSRDVEE